MGGGGVAGDGDGLGCVVGRCGPGWVGVVQGARREGGDGARGIKVAHALLHVVTAADQLQGGGGLVCEGDHEGLEAGVERMQLGVSKDGVRELKGRAVGSNGDGHFLGKFVGPTAEIAGLLVVLAGHVASIPVGTGGDVCQDVWGGRTWAMIAVPRTVTPKPRAAGVECWGEDGVRVGVEDVLECRVT